jgi:putative zincin peptidase
MMTANLLVVFSAGPAVALLAWVYASGWGGASLARGVYGLLQPAILLTTVVPGIVAHELIHALAWSISARKPLSAIRIGFNWRGLSPFAHPRDPMLAGPYRVGAIMPAIVLGFVPAGIATAQGRPLLMAWSLLFILTSGGDFVVLWLIRRVPACRLLQDHPTRAGCRVLAPEIQNGRSESGRS